jgi:dTDP-4-amino-4,6-dideoxygalactose transaminase
VLSNREDHGACAAGADPVATWSNEWYWGMISTVYITKGPTESDNLRRRYHRYGNARTALGALLRSAGCTREDRILLPSYIGWSPREGSGVYDPIRKLGCGTLFYRLDRNLHIDLDHLGNVLAHSRIKVLLIIHYFGYVDPGYGEAVRMARRHGALVVEDEAHAMLTDLVGGACGRLGDASVFSLHKMLPVDSGGLAVINGGGFDGFSGGGECSRGCVLPWDYDLFAISKRRRENTAILTEMLQRLDGMVVPLRGIIGPGEVPQTYPILVKANRDQLYFSLNAAGYGAVSLYHTLISDISREDYPQSHYVSQHILNLPVHQDVDASLLEGMVRELERLLHTLEREY